ncbi:hypothetical protein KR074_007687, partial [Drosophila pseudoananassae]
HKIEKLKTYREFRVLQITSRVEFTNLKCRTTDKEFADVEYCLLKAVNRSYKYASVKINLFKVPITRVKVNLGLYKRMSGYRPFLYNVSVDGCKFLKNRKASPITNYFFEFIRENSNINHSCPYDHDIIVDKLTTEKVNHRLTKVLAFPEGDYMIEMHWMAQDITRIVVNVYLSLS